MAPTSRLAALAAQTPARVAIDLVRLFAQAEARQDKLQWVLREIGDDRGAPHDSAASRACAAVAAAIDGDAARFDQNPYHNRQHFCEVALTAGVLGRMHRLDGEAARVLVLAALIHDFVHDGGRGEAFRNERSSVEHARPLLAAAGMPPVEIERLAAIVLATETSRGTSLMVAACRAHEGHRANLPPLPEAAPELALLVEDPALARQARLLCAADILPSIGLTTEHAMRLQARLAREWGRTLGAHDKLTFIDAVLRQGFVDDFFLPNIEATRRAVIGFRHAPARD